MKNVKKLMGCIVIIFVMVLSFSIKSYAAEVQYSENVIPKMTSNTSPSGKASANSTYTSSLYLAYHAFDHNTSVSSNAWVTAEGVNTGWLEYEFNAAKCITKYTITSRNISYALPELPKNWTFEAWDDQLQEWVVLDTQSNITDWELGVKKEFTFNNVNYYYRYRINITANNGKYYVGIGELEMMETIASLPSSPTSLTAISGDSKVDLSWDAVEEAISYNIKRSSVPGEEVLISSVSGSAISFTDLGLTNGTTYYYVVSAITSDGESANSNEVSATPQEEVTVITGNAIIDIYMDNGTLKQYNLTGLELVDFLTWYDNRSTEVTNTYYVFVIKGSTAPFKSIKEYIPYDKILFFDVKEYNE